MKNRHILIFATASALALAPVTSHAGQKPGGNLFDLLFGAQEQSEPEKPARRADDLSTVLLFGRAAEDRQIAAIKRYEEIVAKGGWPEIGAGPPLRLGAVDERIPDIRRRLFITGDLKNNDPANTEFNQALHDAVIKFQTRHGLPNEGLFGKQTIAALNVPAKERLAQLRVNLERLRQLPALETEPRTIIVNSPGYQLQAAEEGRLALSSRVVVGRPDRQTPVLSAKILAVNLLPTWRVPQSIASRDILPTLVKNPAYLQEENFRVIRQSDGMEIDPAAVKWTGADPASIRFEQAPGANNALGLIRIDMPNPENVYLHDTPLKRLFERTARPFSSGCVRVQKINDLALWLLREQPEWNASRLLSVLQSATPETIKLMTPVPVHFIYLTSWVEADGEINFREDIYKKDGPGTIAQEYVVRDVPKQSLAP